MTDFVLQAPLKTDRPAMRWRGALGDRVFRFRAVWLVRSRDWLVDIATSDGTEIISGHRAAVGTDILAPYNDRRLPAGQLFFRDTQAQGQDPARYDLQGRCQLVWRDPEGVLAAVDTEDEIW